MGFRDLEFGWSHFGVELANVRLTRQLELQELDDDRTWTMRSPFLVGTLAKDDAAREAEFKKYETTTELRYKYTRQLSATAVKPTGRYCELFLGIPDDKKSVSLLDDSRIKGFDFYIREIIPEIDEERRISALAKYGHIAYVKADPEFGHVESVYCQFYALPDLFDHLEKILSVQGIGLSADINVKCWHWIGPIGDSQYYFEKSEGRQIAELASITGTSVHVAAVEPSADESELRDEGGIRKYRPAEASLSDALNILESVNTSNSSIKTAAIITAMACVAIAAALIF